MCWIQIDRKLSLSVPRQLVMSGSASGWILEETLDLWKIREIFTMHLLENERVRVGSRSVGSYPWPYHTSWQYPVPPPVGFLTKHIRFVKISRIFHKFTIIWATITNDRSKTIFSKSTDIKLQNAGLGNFSISVMTANEFQTEFDHFLDRRSRIEFTYGVIRSDFVIRPPKNLRSKENRYFPTKCTKNYQNQITELGERWDTRNVFLLQKKHKGDITEHPFKKNQKNLTFRSN